MYDQQWEDCAGFQLALDSCKGWVKHFSRYLSTSRESDLSSYLNCYSGNTWDPKICPNNKKCTENCTLDGADYKKVYGISANGSSVNLKFISLLDYAKNIGSRSYLMKDDDTYEIFKLAPNLEFTFDVDLSNLPCGLNGALYFVSMDADGGKKRYPTNTAGARYGTGYCDSGCPRDLRYINGEVYKVTP